LDFVKLVGVERLLLGDAIGDAAEAEPARRRDKQITRRRRLILLGIPRAAFSELEMWSWRR